MTVTSVLFQPLLVAGVGVAVMDGLVWSMLIVTVVLAVLPARSTAVPVTAWVSPSVVRVSGAGQTAMPERASLQVKVTVTGVLFHPLPLAAGAALASMVGLVVSTRALTGVLGLPVWPLVSVEATA